MTKPATPTIKDYKTKMQNRITWILAGCVSVFLAVYLPRDLQELFVRMFGEAKGTIGGIEITNISGFITALCGVPLSFVLRWVIFAQDHLATGKSKAGDFFRYYYVTSMIKALHQDIHQTQALKMWFDAFNKWQKPNAREEDQDMFRRVSQRSYSLRLIWYLQRVTVYFIIGSLVMMSAECLFFRRETFVLYMPVKVGILLLAAFLCWWLHGSNTFKKVDEAGYFNKYEATGVKCAPEVRPVGDGFIVRSAGQHVPPATAARTRPG
jgi:hypothetical protein